MQDLWERLEALQAIADTARAEDLEQQPGTIQVRYTPYASAYFAVEAVKRLEQRLLSEMRSGRSLAGYISADFGYGKTATAIYLWKRCLDSEIVAVPPFLFLQLKDIMRATKGWLAHQLSQTRPDLLSRLEEAYSSHIKQDVGDMARTIAADQNIPEHKASSIVEQYIAGHRDVTRTPSLLSFLQDAAGLARDAGFKGLIVFADELQEFVRAEEDARATIQNLSELIKGIRAMSNTPLGLMLTMPVHPTEAAIEEQAGDIMQRMRERETSLLLQDTYGRTFPGDLWQHLCSTSNYQDAESAVESRTLEALGQICARKDLSNGPRTVINAFKRIGHHHRHNREPYTPLDLMEDYRQGHIVFQGRDARLTSTLVRLFEMPVIRDDPQRRQAVEIMAAYPWGVDETKAGPLYRVIEDLAEGEQWLGEHITRLADGYTLVGLQERAESRPKLDEIVRDFRRRWYQVHNEADRVNIGVEGFLLSILPVILPQRAPGHYTDFAGHKKQLGDFARNALGTWHEELEGTFPRLFSRFPERKLRAAVVTSAQALERLTPPGALVDLDFRFLLKTPDDASADMTPSRVVSHANSGRVDFHLNMKRPFGRNFPVELEFLSQVMTSERTSAAVLLGLSAHMAEWLRQHPEAGVVDRSLIETYQDSIRKHAIQLLLPDAADTTKFRTEGFEEGTLSGAGERLVESVFAAKCAQLYPEYKPLMVSRDWKDHLRRYRDVLGKITLAQRRGREPFVGGKDVVAKTFNLTNTGFDSTVRTYQTMGLLEMHTARGQGTSNEVQITFKEHLLELLVLTTLEKEGTTKTVARGTQSRQVQNLEVSRLREAGHKYGYLPDEVDEVLDLLVLRQYVQRDSDGTVSGFAGTPGARELWEQASHVQGRIAALEPHFGNELQNIEAGLERAREDLEGPEEQADDVALDAVQRGIAEARAKLDQFVESKTRALAAGFAEWVGNLERKVSTLKPSEVEQQVTGAVDFVRQVDDERKLLAQRFRQLSQTWQQLQRSVDELLQRAHRAADDAALVELLTVRGRLQLEQTRLEEEATIMQPYLVGLQKWRAIVSKASGVRDRLETSSPFSAQLEEHVTAPVLKTLASHELEALLDWERFLTAVEGIEAAIEADVSQQRDIFHQSKARYEQALSLLIPDRMVRATYDPREPEQSYAVLYADVLRKTQGWLDGDLGTANEVLTQFDYLIRERAIEASDERNAAGSVQAELQAVQGRLNQDLIRDVVQFEAYCTEAQGIHGRLLVAQGLLANKRTVVDPPSEEEKPLLEVLDLQRRTLQEVRNQLGDSGATLDEIFDRLKSLYRKGHIEVEIRRRE